MPRLLTIIAVLFGLATPSLYSQNTRPDDATAFWGTRSDYSAATTSDTELRAARNAFFNGYSGESELTSSSPRQGFKYKQSHSHDETYPYAESQALVIGTVTGSASYLSGDLTTIYSDLQVSINRVLYSTSADTLANGGSVDVLRAGGVVRMPSGKTLIRGNAQESIPIRRRTYVLFLKDIPQTNAFYLVSAFELTTSTVYMLDSIVLTGKALTIQDLKLPPALFLQRVQAGIVASAH